MKRVKLIVSYDGTDYVGWQMQPNGIAIEEVLNRELSALLKENIVIAGASRTDSGVHARGNVAVFDTETRIPAEKICFALNQRLPKDIVIQSSCEVPMDFHPRYVPCTKTYEYRIYNAIHPDPVKRRYSYFVYAPLDIDAMRQAAEYIIGEHDFASFCSAHAQVKTTVRTVYSLDIIDLNSGVNSTGKNKVISDDDKDREELTLNRCGDVSGGVPKGHVINQATDNVSSDNVSSDNMGSPRRTYQASDILIRISGNGFLYNMVRIIVGTLCKVGYHFYPPEHVKEIIAGCDRGLAGPKAPAEGLTLVGIDYEAVNPLMEADEQVTDK